MNVLTYLPNFFSGTMITLFLMVSSLFIGFVLAIFFTIVSLSNVTIAKKFVDLFIFVIRGTPLLVQIFLIYYGIGQFEWIRNSIWWFLLKEPMVCAIISLALNTACYTTILLRGAINSVPKNQIAACEAMGMNKWLALRRIIFPQAFRIALPAYSNEVIMILKGTSLASTITLLDLMGVTQQLIARTYDTVSFYLMAGVIYLILNFIIMGLFHMLMHTLKIADRAASY